jgi:hypothetical protein
MQHQTTLILFLSLHFLLLVDSRPSEQNLDVNYRNNFLSEETPDDFDARAADSVECARCGSAPLKLNIPQKLGTRDKLFLGQETKGESGLNAVTEAKPLMAKQRRQVDAVETLPSAQLAIAPEKHAGELNMKRFEGCRMSHYGRRQRCNYDRCENSGGRCKMAIFDGQEGCAQSRILENGEIVTVSWVRELQNCRWRRCRKKLVKPKPVTSHDNLEPLGSRL